MGSLMAELRDKDKKNPKPVPKADDKGKEPAK